MNEEIRYCQNCKTQFTIEPEDFAFYEKMKVPAPTRCPICRFQRRLSFLNSRELYKRTCALCEKSIISMYAPESAATVYCNQCWWSDKWDGLQYGKEYDPKRPFFEQLKELYHSVPQMPLQTNYPTLVNSEYVNHAATAKNCYLIFVADECENVLYSEYMLQNKDSMDSTMFIFSELCYGSNICGKMFRAFFCEDCGSCHDVYFCKDCSGCSDCFGCIGLRNKQYYIFNQPYTKEEYIKKLKEFGIESYHNLSKMKKEVEAFWLKYPNRFAHMVRNVNVTGEYVYESKNSKDMYDVAAGAEDSRFCQLLTMPGTKDTYDYTFWGHSAQRVYEGMSVGEGVNNVKFSFEVWPNAHDIEYSFQTLSSSYLFGCAGLRNKQYCILNKQYSKKEYNALREKIIDDMKGQAYGYGEFPPPELSFFGYNETFAQDFLPLTPEKAKALGFSWKETKQSGYQTTLKGADVPDTIAATTDAIVQEIIECEECKRAFRILSAELDLLRRFNLPAPHECPNCRYKERWKRINKPGLYPGKCQCAGNASANNAYQNTTQHLHGDARCENEFKTPYAPDRPEIVYCEQCYQIETT